jgi:PAS domain S-box-containing protein
MNFTGQFQQNARVTEPFLKTFSKISQLIFKADSVETLTKDACDVLAGHGGYKGLRLRIETGRHRTGLTAACGNEDDHPSVSYQLVHRGESVGSMDVLRDPDSEIGPDEHSFLTATAEALAFGITTLDIEARRQKAEQANNEVQKAAGIGRWELDLATHNLTWSDSIYEMFETKRTEIPESHESFLEFVHPDDRQALDQEFEKSLSGLTTYAFKHRLIMSDGRIKWVQETGRYKTGPSGIPETLVGTVQDITALQLAFDELSSSEKLLVKIFEVVPVGLWLSDSRGRLIRSNEAGRKIWGAERLVGQQEYGIFNARRLPSGEPVAPDDWSLAHAINKGITILNELLEIDAFDGRKRTILNSTAPIIGHGGNIEGAIVVNMDMTEYMRLQQEKDTLEERFRQSQKLEAIGQLAGGVAHDFNNMLGIILGYSEDIIRRPPGAERLLNSVNQIIEAGNRSATLTRQLMAFSRNLPLQAEVVNVNDRIINLEKMLRRVIGENIELVTNLPQDICPVKIDPGQFDQILMNLIVNARDAIHGSGRIVIETGAKILSQKDCSFMEGLQPGVHLVLTVTDNGCGMDESLKERIFEPFFSTKDKSKGTGLGLSTVYGVVKQSGGGIEVFSEPNVGSTFKIYLPFTLPDLPPVHKGKIDGLEAGTNQHILVVEDEPMLLTFLKDILEELNYRVTTASNGKEALQIIMQGETLPDLIISDVVMPEMSGVELAQQLKNTMPDMKILLMSGYIDTTIINGSRIDQGMPFLQKPFHVTELSSIVSKLLD